MSLINMHMIIVSFGSKNPFVSDANLCIRPDCKRVVRGGSWADGCCHQRIDTAAGRDICTETRVAVKEGLR